MRTSRGQRSTTALVDLGFRRQPQSLLGELGSDGRGASVGGDDRGLVEGRRNLGVWFVAGQREVARTNDRVVDDYLQCERERSGAGRRGRCRAPTTATDA